MSTELPQDRIEALLDRIAENHYEFPEWHWAHDNTLPEEFRADIRDMLEELKAHQALVSEIGNIAYGTRTSALKVTAIRRALEAN